VRDETVASLNALLARIDPDTGVIAPPDPVPHGSRRYDDAVRDLPEELAPGGTTGAVHGAGTGRDLVRRLSDPQNAV
jgi:hypothetical protein